MADLATLEAAISGVLRSRELDLFDLELRRGVLCVTVSRAGGLGLEDLADASKAVSNLLDENEALVEDEPYELEVTSPGVERRLRRPEHFRSSVAERVALRTKAEVPGERRFEGVVDAVTDESVTLKLDGDVTRTVRFEDIDRAHTVFDWRAALASDRQERPAERKHNDRGDDVRSEQMDSQKGRNTSTGEGPSALQVTEMRENER